MITSVRRASLPGSAQRRKDTARWQASMTARAWARLQPRHTAARASGSIPSPGSASSTQASGWSSILRAGRTASLHDNELIPLSS
ncbi:hypothetical protein ACWCQE_40095 [Streptomyces sp. NPDC002409]